MYFSERFFVLALSLMACTANADVVQQRMQKEELGEYIAAAQELKGRRLSDAPRFEMSLQDLEDAMTSKAGNMIKENKEQGTRSLLRDRFQNSQIGKKIGGGANKPGSGSGSEPAPEPAASNPAVQEAKEKAAAAKAQATKKKDEAAAAAAAKKTEVQEKVAEVTAAAKEKITGNTQGINSKIGASSQSVSISVADILAQMGFVPTENEMVINLIKGMFPIWVIFFFKPCSGLDIFLGVLDALPLEDLKVLCPARQFKPEVCSLDFFVQDSELVCGTLLHTIDSIFSKLPIRPREGTCVEACQVWYATYCSGCEGGGAVAQPKALNVLAKIDARKEAFAAKVAGAKDNVGAKRGGK